MARVFLYTAEATVSPKDAAALRKAGVVPVQVASLDAVRLLDAEAAVLPGDAILRAALEALTLYPQITNADNMRERFVRRLHESAVKGGGA